MSKKKKAAISLIIVVVLVLSVLIYLRIRANIIASQKKNVSTPSVTLSNPTQGNITKKLNFSGNILAIQQANIYSRVNGNIEKIYADIGDYVSNGSLLARIDNSTYIQTVKQLEGIYKQAIATHENNKINLERIRELYDKGLAPKGDLDNAETTLRVSAAQVETSLANLRNNQIQLEYCNIRAPFSGYITKRLLDVGSLVSSGNQTTSNIIFILSDLRNLKVMVNILDKDINSIDEVEEAIITTDTYPDETFSGKIKRTSQALDLNTRTMPVEIDIENKNNKLKPGMFASIDLILSKHENALLLPQQSILKDDKGNFVFMISSDSLSVKQYVTKGYEEDNKVEILDGISITDKIVTVGQELIREGIKVKISK